MITYLKPKIYYSDLYDKGTVFQCRMIEKAFNAMKCSGKKAVVAKGAKELMIYWETGERYIKKESKIAEWMKDDKDKDDKLQNAIAPSPVYCLNCGAEIIDCNYRNLDDRDGDIEKVLFHYECSKCHKRRFFWEGGKEMEPKKSYCKKCGGIQKLEFKDTKRKLTTTYICFQCGEKEVSTINLDKDDADNEDVEYLKDRERFCLNEEKGWKYMDYKQAMDSISELMKESEEKEKNKHIYDAVAKLQKLKVSELQDLLNKKLKKENYTKLEFTKTEITSDVIVSFTIQDEQKGREEYNSRKQLEKAIAKSLSDTNWRLMTEGVNYRLGILSGRLRGYEREEDLVKLVQKNDKNIK